MAKAPCQNTSDGEGRRLGEQIGLDLFEGQKGEAQREEQPFLQNKLRRCIFLVSLSLSTKNPSSPSSK